MFTKDSPKERSMRFTSCRALHQEKVQYWCCLQFQSHDSMMNWYIDPGDPRYQNTLGKQIVSRNLNIGCIYSDYEDTVCVPSAFQSVWMWMVKVALWAAEELWKIYTLYLDYADTICFPSAFWYLAPPGSMYQVILKSLDWNWSYHLCFSPDEAP